MVHPSTFRLLTIAVLSFIFNACNQGGGASTETSGVDTMAQMAGDPDFQAAHEKPEALAFTGKGTMTEFPTPDGKQASAYILRPEGMTAGKTLMVFHEWWGLNDYVKREADRLFDSLGNVIVIAPDLYDGIVATSPDDAGKLMQNLSSERAKAIVEGAFGLAGDQAEIATIGWCMGGGWSLQASIMAGASAKGCVMYYGMPVQNAKELAPLKADVLFIHPTQDAWITQEVVDKFKALAKSTKKQVTVHQFDADHAFANPSNPKHNPEATQQANALALAFLRERLK